MADAAPVHDASVTFVQAGLRPPAGLDRFDVVVVDSITTWRLAPWLGLRVPLVGLAHQPPGGIDTSAVRRRVQRPLDRFVYARCDVVIAASRALADELIGEHGLDPEKVGSSSRAVICPPCRRRRTCGAVDGSPSSAWPTGSPTRASTSCSTPSARCRTTPSRCTSPVAKTSITATPAGSAGSSTTTARRACRRPRPPRPPDGRPSVRRRRRVRPADSCRDVRHGRRRGAAGRSAGGRLAHRQPAQPDHRWCRRPPAGGGRRRRAVDARSAGSPTTRPGGRSSRRPLAGAVPSCRRGPRRRRRSSARCAASLPGAVEPAHDGTARLDVDAADAGVLDVQPPGHADGDVERPGQRRLDRADVADDDHH